MQGNDSTLSCTHNNHESQQEFGESLFNVLTIKKTEITNLLIGLETIHCSVMCPRFRVQDLYISTFLPLTHLFLDK